MGLIVAYSLVRKQNGIDFIDVIFQESIYKILEKYPSYGR